uniref:Uncharacterized protein n=1 Tax=Glomus sp. DAOM 240422 TaxID=1281822 RepID=S4UJR3_9GLOM|nr:hypothetical protein [Glomus sp. DAOM 240422]
MNNSGIKLKEVERPTANQIKRNDDADTQGETSLRTISLKSEGNRIIGAEGLIKTFSYYLNYFELNRKINNLINCSINPVNDLSIYRLKGERTLVFYPGNDIQKDLLSVALIACIT